EASRTMAGYDAVYAIRVRFVNANHVIALYDPVAAASVSIGLKPTENPVTNQGTKPMRACSPPQRTTLAQSDTMMEPSSLATKKATIALMRASEAADPYVREAW